MKRRYGQKLAWLGLLALLLRCARSPDTAAFVGTGQPSTSAAAGVRAGPAAAAAAPAPSAAAPPRSTASAEPSEPALPAGAEFVAVGRHWASLRRVCALTPLGEALYAAHAYGALSIDGATITRYAPNAEKPFALAFDWNRRGQPVKGGGAGQGFIRLRAIGGRLYLPDADPPYVGFRLSGKGIEGYVFVSDSDGKFARSRHPGHLPPAQPTNEAPGAALLPYAYHVFDVTRFRGQLYASGGAHAPGGAAPGALFAATDGGWRWEPVAHFPDPPDRHVWRLTFMTVFGDRLYAGVETFAAGDPTDYVSFALGAGATHLTSADGHAVHKAVEGGATTLRWRVDAGRLFWIASHAHGTTLQVSRDGVTWSRIALPVEAGPPLDLIRFRGALMILTERRLLQLRGSELIEVARVEGEKSPFELDDLYCPAPLGVFKGELYAGGQRKGRLYRLTWPEETRAVDPGKSGEAQATGR